MIHSRWFIIFLKSLYTYTAPGGVFQLRIFLGIMYCLLTIAPGMASQTDTGAIRGRVSSQQTGEPLVGAQVMILDTTFGTITDQRGVYHLRIPAGTYQLRIQMAGYRADTVAVRIKSDTILRRDVQLASRPYISREVTVTDTLSPLHGGPMGLILPHTALQTGYAIGEADLFRTVQSLPGVTHTSDYSSLLYIRGSAPNQTLITYDDVPVLNPYHLGGMYGMFNTDGVERVEFAPGIVDARYGGYLGGHLNVVPKAGPGAEKRQTNLRLGMLASSATTGHSPGRGTLFLGARRTYFDLVSGAFNEQPPYYFFDLHGGYQLPLTPKQSLSVQMYYSQDALTNVLETDEHEDVAGSQQPVWGNRIASIRYRWSPTARWKVHSHLYYSAGEVFANTEHVNVNNVLDDFSWRGEMTHRIAAHQLQAGIQIRRTRYRYNWRFHNAIELRDLVGPPQELFFDGAPEVYNFAQRAWRHEIYLQDVWQASSAMMLRSGVRLTLPGAVQNASVSPRFQVQFASSPTLQWTGTYAHHHQWHYTLKRQQNAMFSAPFSAYFPVKGGGPSLQSDYLALGMITSLPGGFQLRVETYAKSMRNIPAMEIRPAKQVLQRHEAAGLDLLIERRSHTGWQFMGNYALSMIRIHSGEQTYPASYHRPHSVNLLGGYRWQNGWEISLSGVLYSGLPFTPILGKFVGAGLTEPRWIIGQAASLARGWGEVYGPRNRLRFPPYKRIDIGVSRTWFYRRSTLTLTAQILNCLWFRNPLEYGLDLQYIPVQQDNTYNLPLLPTFQVAFQF